MFLCHLFKTNKLNNVIHIINITVGVVPKMDINLSSHHNATPYSRNIPLIKRYKIIKNIIIILNICLHLYILRNVMLHNIIKIKAITDPNDITIP